MTTPNGDKNLEENSPAEPTPAIESSARSSRPKSRWDKLLVCLSIIGGVLAPYSAVRVHLLDSRQDRYDIRDHLNEAWEHLGGESSGILINQLSRSPGKRLAARQEVELALILDSRSERAHLYKGLVEFADGKVDEARSIFERLVREHPDFVDAHVYLGLLHLSEGRSDLAFRALKEAKRLRPDDAVVRLTLGKALARNGEIEAAKDEFRAVLERQPHNAFAQGNLAALEGDITKAVAAYEKAVQYDPTNASLFLNLGKCRYLAGDLAGAESAIEQAIDLDPADPEAPRLLSQLRRFRRGVTTGDVVRHRTKDLGGSSASAPARMGWPRR